MYLLDADDDAIAAAASRSPRSATRSSSSGATGCGTSTCTSTTSAPRSRRASSAGRPHRVAGHPLRRPGRTGAARAAARPAAGRRAVASGPGLAALFEEAGAVVVPPARAALPSTASSLARDPGERCRRGRPAAQRPRTRAAAEAAPAAARGRHARGGDPDRAQVQGSPPSPCTTRAPFRPGPRRDDGGRAHAARLRCRHGAAESHHLGGLCEPGDVLGAVDGDFVGRRRRPVDVAVRRRRPDARPAAASWSRRRGREDDGLAEAPRPPAATARPSRSPVYDGGQPRYPLLFGVE